MTQEVEVPIRRALGEEWQRLGPVIREHYDLSPARPKRLLCDGAMDVFLSPMGKLLVTLGRPVGALVPFAGRDVPVQVRNWSAADSEAMFWHRSFHFPGRRPVLFRSRMEFLHDNRIVEFVRFRLGIRMDLSVENGSLRYDSRGYLWKLGPLRLVIPDWLLLGRAVIRETPLSEDEFQVDLHIHHPWWGQTFGYRGRFRLSEENME